jgi:hypothetical protein
VQCTCGRGRQPLLVGAHPGLGAGGAPAAALPRRRSLHRDAAWSTHACMAAVAAAMKTLPWRASSKSQPGTSAHSRARQSGKKRHKQCIPGHGLCWQAHAAKLSSCLVQRALCAVFLLVLRCICPLAARRPAPAAVRLLGRLSGRLQLSLPLQIKESRVQSGNVTVGTQMPCRQHCVHHQAEAECVHFWQTTKQSSCVCQLQCAAGMMTAGSPPGLRRWRLSWQPASRCSLRSKPSTPAHHYVRPECAAVVTACRTMHSKHDSCKSISRG